MRRTYTMNDIKRGIEATKAAEAKYQTLKKNYWETSAGNTLMDEVQKKKQQKKDAAEMKRFLESMRSEIDEFQFPDPSEGRDPLISKNEEIRDFLKIKLREAALETKDGEDELALVAREKRLMQQIDVIFGEKNWRDSLDLLGYMKWERSSEESKGDDDQTYLLKSSARALKTNPFPKIIGSARRLRFFPPPPSKRKLNFTDQYERGQSVLYDDMITGETREANVVKVHQDDPEGPYYTIRFADNSNERQTPGSRLNAKLTPEDVGDVMTEDVGDVMSDNEIERLTAAAPAALAPAADNASSSSEEEEEEEAPAADNASSSVWANVKEFFNIRLNPLSGEALSRMYQQPAQRTATQTTATQTTATQPPTTTQTQPQRTAIATQTQPPPTTIATQTQPPTTTQTEVAPAIPGMDSLIVAMQDLNDSVMTSKGELSKAVADAAEAISKSVDAANKPQQPSKTTQPPQTSQPPQPQTKESQQERMLRAIENINLQNRIGGGGGGGGCGVGLNSLGNVGLIGRLTEKSPNTVDVATKVLEAAVLGENTLTTNILNQREKLNQDVQNKSRELDRLLKTREREEMELALSTELADMQKEYSNATKRMKKDTTEKEKMLVKYAKELQLKDEERRVETNAAVEAMIETYRDEFEKALKESEKGIYSKVFGEAEEILRKKLRDQQVALEEDGRALNNDIREACTGREEDLVTNVYEAVTSPEDPCLSEVERMVLEHSRREAGLDADVLMYTQPDCAACDEARDMLEDQNIKYISFDLSEAPDFAALVEDQPKPMMFRVSGPMPEWISWESMRDFR